MSLNCRLVMPTKKTTSAGCPLFTGTVFKDYLDGEFRMFLRRQGIARVLDPSKDPRLLYEMPSPLAPFAEEAPRTAPLPTPRTRRRGSATSPESSPPPVTDKERLSYERLVQSVRTERMRIQEKYDSWDADCEKAFGHLYEAIPAEARRRVARVTSDSLQDMVKVLCEHYKNRTVLEEMRLLLEFITTAVNPKAARR